MAGSFPWWIFLRERGEPEAVDEKRKYEPRTYQPISEQTKTRIKIGVGITAVVAAIAGDYICNGPFNPNKVEDIHTSNLTVLNSEFGYLQDVIRTDVTGDGQEDTVRIYGKGYVFYTQDSEQTYFGTMYHRIHSGTPEAQRLLQAHPMWLRDSQGW